MHHLTAEPVDYSEFSNYVVPSWAANHRSFKETRGAVCQHKADKPHTDLSIGSPVPTGRQAVGAWRPYLYPFLQPAQANVAFQDFVEDPVLLDL